MGDKLQKKFISKGRQTRDISIERHLSFGPGVGV